MKNKQKSFMGTINTMKIVLAIILVSCIHQSCNDQPKTNNKAIPKQQNLDSLANVFIQLYDSTSLAYEWEYYLYDVFKVYLQKDTMKVVEGLNWLIYQRQEADSFKDIFSNQLGLKKLEELNFEEVYRFTLTRAFYPNIIAITAYKNKHLYKLEVLDVIPNDTDNHCFSGVKSKLYMAEKILTKKQWQVLVDKINGAYFWSLAPFNRDGGFDGSYWIIEGKKKSIPISDMTMMYHLVSRWSPHEGSFKDIGLHLIELSNQVMF